MYVKAYAMLLVAIMIGVVGQLLLKHGMSRRPSFRLRDLASLGRDFPIVAGFCCYGIATLFYLKVLARQIGGELPMAMPWRTMEEFVKERCWRASTSPSLTRL